MALLAGKRLSLIKTLAKQGSNFSNKVVYAPNLSNKSSLHRLLYNPVNDQHIRLASTTSKKKNVISFSDFHGLQEFALEPKQNDFLFEDSEKAFKAKSNFELLRGYLVFQLCGVKFLLENQKMVKILLLLL